MIAHSKSLPIFVLGIILLIGSCSKESRSVTEPEQSLHTFGSLEGYLRRALPYTGGVPYATVEIAGRTVASAPSTPYESWYYVDSIPVGRQSVTVRHPAFEPFSDSVTIYAGTREDYYLQPKTRDNLRGLLAAPAMQFTLVQEQTHPVDPAFHWGGTATWTLTGVDTSSGLAHVTFRKIFSGTRRDLHSGDTITIVADTTWVEFVENSSQRISADMSFQHPLIWSYGTVAFPRYSPIIVGDTLQLTSGLVYLNQDHGLQQLYLVPYSGNHAFCFSYDRIR